MNVKPVRFLYAMPRPSKLWAAPMPDQLEEDDDSPLSVGPELTLEEMFGPPDEEWVRPEE